MRIPFPSGVRLKPTPPAPPAKPKSLLSRRVHALPDVLWTSILALKESADAFPPLKSAVGGVIVLCDIAERTRHCKSGARDIALRTKEILDVIADAVPDPSMIPPSMLKICSTMEQISLTGSVSRFVYLNRNERMLKDIRSRLAASALRLEVQQMRLEVQQTHITLQQSRLAMNQAQTHADVKKVVSATDVLVPDVARVLTYSKFVVLFSFGRFHDTCNTSQPPMVDWGSLWGPMTRFRGRWTRHFPELY
ncbi:hypothetical protein B0H14DRAFT_2897342 [Mycena olivaceomarginata]|nr:hypothetical protein B0H14DRAFT_2897342 [Mycena olivaceomarginata]